MIKISTKLHCRYCPKFLEGTSSGVAMTEWIKMIANENGWEKIDVHGLERFVCPNCQKSEMMQYSELKIGQRVRYVGTGVTGECEGEVLRLYRPEPEEEFPGAIEMKPDRLPDKWPYPGYSTFAPWVDNLEEVE